MNGSPRYKAPIPQMTPEEKSAADMIKEQASSMAMEAGAEAAQEAGTEYIVDPLKAKAKEMWTGFSAPAPATAPASSFTSAPFASANIGPGGGMGNAFSPTVLPAELTGPMMSGSQTATADAILSSGMTGAEALAGAGSLAPAAAAPVASTVAPAVASTVAPAVAGAGPMAAMMASPLAPLAIGALAGKAFGLFDKGGYVNGPLAKVEYREAGGPTRGPRIDSEGQPFNSASMFRSIASMPEGNALIQEVMNKYNVNAYQAAVIIAESKGSQMNDDFLLNSTMEEIFDGPGGHGATAQKVLNTAPSYVKEKYPDYAGPLSKDGYVSGPLASN